MNRIFLDLGLQPCKTIFKKINPKLKYRLKIFFNENNCLISKRISSKNV